MQRRVGDVRSDIIITIASLAVTVAAFSLAWLLQDQGRFTVILIYVAGGAYIIFAIFIVRSVGSALKMLFRRLTRGD